MLSICKQPLRRLRNHAAYSLVAVLGLVIGLIAFMFIGALVGGWYAADWWLRHFAYRVAQSWSGFVLCAVLVAASLLIVILLQMRYAAPIR